MSATQDSLHVEEPLSPAALSARRWTVAALLMVMVLASMEATVTSTAMPTIVGALQGLEHYAWVAAVYLLASTLTMPIYGRLADLLGRKRVLISAIALFALGSLCASFAQSMLQLIIFRGVQGLGAGGIMPVVLTIIGDIFTIEQRAKAQAAFSAVWGTASLAGPALGWFLVGTAAFRPYVPALFRVYLGWPTVFWVNLPLALAAVVVLVIKFEDRHHHHAAADSSPGAAPSATPKEAAPVGTGSMVMSILRSPIILPCLISNALMGVGVFALETFVPLYVQGGRGMSPGAAAATVTPVMLAWSTSSIFYASRISRWGFRKMSLIGAAMQSIGFLGLLVAAFFHGPLWTITGSLFISGLGFSPGSMATLLAAQDAATYRQRGMATAGITFARNLGGAFGIAILGAILNVLTAPGLAAAHLPFPTSQLLDSHKLDAIRQQYPEPLRAAQGAISGGLLWIFGAILAVTLVQWWLARLLPVTKRAKSANRAEAIEAGIS